MEAQVKVNIISNQAANIISNEPSDYPLWCNLSDCLSIQANRVNF